MFPYGAQWIALLEQAMRAKTRQATGAFALAFDGTMLEVKMGAKFLHSLNDLDALAKLPGANKYTTKCQLYCALNQASVERIKPSSKAEVQAMLARVFESFEAAFVPGEGRRAPLASTRLRLALDDWRNGDADMPWIAEKNSNLVWHFSLHK